MDEWEESVTTSVDPVFNRRQACLALEILCECYKDSFYILPMVTSDEDNHPLFHMALLCDDPPPGKDLRFHIAFEKNKFYQFITTHAEKLGVTFQEESGRVEVGVYERFSLRILDSEKISTLRAQIFSLLKNTLSNTDIKRLFLMVFWKGTSYFAVKDKYDERGNYRFPDLSQSSAVEKEFIKVTQYIKKNVRHENIKHYFTLLELEKHFAEFKSINLTESKAILFSPFEKEKEGYKARENVTPTQPLREAFRKT